MDPKVVLVADDEAVVRNFVVFALRRENFIVHSTSKPDEALQVFRNQAIDLLLTDIQMGDGMNGVELAEQIMEEKPGTKVLVMSGFPEKELPATEKNLPFLSKPFTAAILIERVRELLESKITVQSETKNSSSKSKIKTG